MFAHQNNGEYENEGCSCDPSHNREAKSKILWIMIYWRENPYILLWIRLTFIIIFLDHKKESVIALTYLLNVYYNKTNFKSFDTEIF